MKKQQDKNLLLFISIGVIAFLLLRKKPLQTQKKAGSGTGGSKAACKRSFPLPAAPEGVGTTAAYRSTIPVELHPPV